MKDEMRSEAKSGVTAVLNGFIRSSNWSVFYSSLHQAEQYIQNSSQLAMMFTRLCCMTALSYKLNLVLVIDKVLGHLSRKETNNF